MCWKYTNVFCATVRCSWVRLIRILDFSLSISRIAMRLKDRMALDGFKVDRVYGKLCMKAILDPLGIGFKNNLLIVQRDGFFIEKVYGIPSG